MSTETLNTFEIIKKFIRFAGAGANGHWGASIRLEDYPQGMINRIANMFNRMEAAKTYIGLYDQYISLICEFGEAVLANQQNGYLKGYQVPFDTTQVLDDFITPIHQVIRDLAWYNNQLIAEKCKLEPDTEVCKELQLIIDIAEGGIWYGLKVAISGITKRNLLGIECRGYFLENEIA